MRADPEATDARFVGENPAANRARFPRVIETPREEAVFGSVRFDPVVVVDLPSFRGMMVGGRRSRRPGEHLPSLASRERKDGRKDGLHLYLSLSVGAAVPVSSGRARSPAAETGRPTGSVLDDLLLDDLLLDVVVRLAVQGSADLRDDDVRQQVVHLVEDRRRRRRGGGCRRPELVHREGPAGSVLVVGILVLLVVVVIPLSLEETEDVRFLHRDAFLRFQELPGLDLFLLFVVVGIVAVPAAGRGLPLFGFRHGGEILQDRHVLSVVVEGSPDQVVERGLRQRGLAAAATAAALLGAQLREVEGGGDGELRVVELALRRPIDPEEEVPRQRGELKRPGRLPLSPRSSAAVVAAVIVVLFVRIQELGRDLDLEIVGVLVEIVVAPARRGQRPLLAIRLEELLQCRDGFLVVVVLVAASAPSDDEARRGDPRDVPDRKDVGAPLDHTLGVRPLLDLRRGRRFPPLPSHQRLAHDQPEAGLVEKGRPNVVRHREGSAADVEAIQKDPDGLRRVLRPLLEVVLEQARVQDGKEPLR
mmetsp:Transcript_27408/g.64211  ORF Transcript_27408/g.64211 Transcript_27408/m.64211 type:complete len:533 (-) Transcript_27408:95-1693(-)